MHLSQISLRPASSRRITSLRRVPAMTAHRSGEDGRQGPIRTIRTMSVVEVVLRYQPLFNVLIKWKAISPVHNQALHKLTGP